MYPTLLAYHWHTTHKLLDLAADLHGDGYHRYPGFGYGSMHDLFVHLLTVSYSWRTALETGQQPPRLTAENYPDLAAVRAGLAEEQAKWLAYVAGVDPTADITLTTRTGETSTTPLWRILQHFILHGMQHHSELAQLLTIVGRSPGNIDFIFYDECEG